MHLNGGDKVQISDSYPLFNTYVFGLYKPGTTDASFPHATAVASAADSNQVTKAVLESVLHVARRRDDAGQDERQG